RLEQPFEQPLQAVRGKGRVDLALVTGIMIEEASMPLFSERIVDRERFGPVFVEGEAHYLETISLRAQMSREVVAHSLLIGVPFFYIFQLYHLVWILNGVGKTALFCRKLWKVAKSFNHKETEVKTLCVLSLFVVKIYLL